MRFPTGTFLIISSTSIGAGITTEPVPQHSLILSVIFSTLDSPLLLFGFSTHIGFFIGKKFTYTNLLKAFNRILSGRSFIHASYARTSQIQLLLM
jgi:hypothetical protein